MLRLSRPPLSLVPVISIAVAVALTGTVFFRTSDILPGDIATALTPDPRAVGSPDSGPLDLMIVCGAPTDVVRGMQIGLLFFILGNVPAATVASILVALRSNRHSRPWTGPWADAFFAGFIFQAGGLMFTGLLIAVPLAVASDSARTAWESPFGGLLLSNLVCSIFGLRSWRALESEAHASNTALTRIHLVR